MSSVKTLLNTSIGLKKRYLLQSIIGTSELAATFEALDDKQTVVVKYYQNTEHEFKDLLQKAIKYQMQFKDQAQKIVPIHEFGITGDGHLWLMMENQSPAQNLKNWYQDSKNQTLGAAVHILHQLAEILKIVHQNGQPHGNIKPTNLFVGSGDQVKISDMGGVGLYGVHKKEKIRTVINDPSYFSPEQANGKEINLYSDIFSLGAIGYFLLTGDLPFTGTTSDKILTNIIVTSPKINANQVKDQSKPNETLELVDMLNQCLSKNISNRPQSLQKLIDQLESLSKKLPHTVKISTATAVGIGGVSGFSRQTASYQLRDIEVALQGNHGISHQANHSANTSTSSTSWATTTGSNTSGSWSKVNATKTTTGSWASISNSSSLNDHQTSTIPATTPTTTATTTQDWASTSTPNANASNGVNASWSNTKPQFKTGSWSGSKFSTGSWALPNLTPPVVPNLNPPTQDDMFKTSIGTPALNPFANIDLNQIHQQESWQKVIEAIPEPKPIPIQDAPIKLPPPPEPENALIPSTSDWGSLVDDFVVPENTPPENVNGIESIDQSLNSLANDMIDHFDDSVVDLADHANWDEATPTDDLETAGQSNNLADFQQNSSYTSDFDLGDLIEDALEEVEGHVLQNHSDSTSIQHQIQSTSSTYDELLKENLSPIYEDGRVTNPIPLEPVVIQAEPQVFSTEYDRIPNHLLSELKSLNQEQVHANQTQIHVDQAHTDVDMPKITLPSSSAHTLPSSLSSSASIPMVEPLIKAGANQPEHILNILMNVPLQLKGHLLTFSHFQLPIEDIALDSGYFPTQVNDHSMMANYLGSQVGFDFSAHVEKNQEISIDNRFIAPQEHQKNRKLIIEIILAMILLGIGIFFGMNHFKSTNDESNLNLSKPRAISPQIQTPSINQNNQNNQEITPSDDLEIEDIMIEDASKKDIPKQEEIKEEIKKDIQPEIIKKDVPKKLILKKDPPKKDPPKKDPPKKDPPKKDPPKKDPPKSKPKEEKKKPADEIESPF